MKSHLDLTDYLISAGTLHSENMIHAFRKIDRSDFLRPNEQAIAYEDKALPIGFGQTNSQPTVVAFMLELLAPQQNDRILDIGSGSAWTTALLAESVGPKGQVTGLELLPELVKFGKSNLKKYNFKNTTILQAKAGVLGLPDEPAFDRILVSATIDHLPAELLPQFRHRLVIPIKNSIWVIDQKEYPGFSFVPLL